MATMKIALLSDLHLSVQPLEPPPTDADVIVLAGDLHRPAGAIEWARRYDGRPTLFVAGNHEFYGSDIATTLRELREHARGTSVQVLERSVWRHGGVRFLGCTLWSDYRLYPSREARDEALSKVTTMVRDFTRIRIAPDFDDLLTPAVSQQLFDASVAWLEEQFADASGSEPTVVVTHFAPSTGSIAERFAGSPLNACFVSDLDERIRRWQPRLWLHGHVHDSFDYRIGDTRIVANPRGYAPKGVVENKAFDPGLVLEIDA
jgi:Icc-related predicted phosphoesterase